MAVAYHFRMTRSSPKATTRRNVARRCNRVLAVALIAVCASSPPLPAFAQARAGDDPVAPSALAPLFVQFEDALAPRLIGADDAASRWISGRLSTLEPAVQARDYAAAAARDPKELLYVASLADACLRTPGIAECTERDAVGYWAARDGDNAVPWLLQAERARRRNNVPSLVENLERASRSSRYDSYDHRAGAVIWSKLASATPANERGAAALYAVNTSTAAGAPLQALEGVCSPQSRGLDARIAAACARLAVLMAERASLLNDRRAGTQIALTAASDDGAKSSASERARAVVEQQDRCRESLQALERAAIGTPDQRQRAATLGEQFVNGRARDGEASACDALARTLAAR
jgi:hypothetical protein